MNEEWVTLDDAHVFVSALNGTPTHIQRANVYTTMLCGLGWLQDEDRDVSRRPLQRAHICADCLRGLSAHLCA